MKIGIVGLGLIGGSFARDLKAQINVDVLGVDKNEGHQEAAIELGLVHAVVDLDYAIANCDFLILSIPVDVLENLLVYVLDRISDKQVVTDVGSTKANLCDKVKFHPKRGRYVSAHPLAGTEFSGPTAAIKGLFQNKKNIICDPELSDKDALELAKRVFDSVGLQSFTMPSNEHDKHLAYVSHLSHVTSFMLGQTVLDIERDEKQIFNLASTGFESTVRLAKSNPKTWSAIFTKNKFHLTAALDQYITWMMKFKTAIENGDTELIEQYMTSANDIKRVLNNK